MRNQFPKTDKCDFCESKHTKQSDDEADLCDKCWKESAVLCDKCKCSMVWTISIYRVNNMKLCQLCEMYTSSDGI